LQLIFKKQPGIKKSNDYTEHEHFVYSVCREITWRTVKIMHFEVVDDAVSGLFVFESFSLWNEHVFLCVFLTLRTRIA